MHTSTFYWLDVSRLCLQVYILNILFHITGAIPAGGNVEGPKNTAVILGDTLFLRNDANCASDTKWFRSQSIEDHIYSVDITDKCMQDCNCVIKNASSDEAGVYTVQDGQNQRHALVDVVSQLECGISEQIFYRAIHFYCRMQFWGELIPSVRCLEFDCFCTHEVQTVICEAFVPISSIELKQKRSYESFFEDGSVPLSVKSMFSASYNVPTYINNCTSVVDLSKHLRTSMIPLSELMQTTHNYQTVEKMNYVVPATLILLLGLCLVVSIAIHVRTCRQARSCKAKATSIRKSSGTSNIEYEPTGTPTGKSVIKTASRRWLLTEIPTVKLIKPEAKISKGWA